jgi:hypothetical protein
MGEAGGGEGMAGNKDLILKERRRSLSSGRASRVPVGRVSKDGLSWFETALARLLTMRTASARAWLERQIHPRQNPPNPVNLTKSRFMSPSLDFWGRAAITAQPLGSLGGNMRNKITKLLIVVVPRRTAGDG